jgi:cell division cycle 20-like protein 1 (cofactor of APC complex)
MARVDFSPSHKWTCIEEGYALQNSEERLNSHAIDGLKPRSNMHTRVLCNELLVNSNQTYLYDSNNENDPLRVSLLPDTHRIMARAKRARFNQNCQYPRPPFTALDAIGYCDDYYRSNFAWGDKNIMAIYLPGGLYLMDRSNGTRQSLSTQDFREQTADHANDELKIRSLVWSPSGDTLGTGDENGVMRFWRHGEMTETSIINVHRGRIASLSWQSSAVASAGVDGNVVVGDMRTPRFKRCTVHQAHKGSALGVAWSHDGQYLASGGSDKCVCVWDPRALFDRRGEAAPLYSLPEIHDSSVKAMAWSPHQEGLLATGGGYADAAINVLDTLRGKYVKRINTGAQVCDVKWAKNTTDLITAQGDGNVMVWTQMHSSSSYTRVGALGCHRKR